MALIYTKMDVALCRHVKSIIGLSWLRKTSKCSSQIRFLNTHPKNEISLDMKEIDHFSGCRSLWWDSEKKMKVLHSINTFRVPFIINGLKVAAAFSVPAMKPEDSIKEFKILEVGCGAGILTEPLSLTGASVTGLDPSADLIAEAKNHAASNLGTNNLSYINDTIEDHSRDKKDFYDAVIASEVVEHVADPEIFIKSCVDALKPGGSLFVTTPQQRYLTWFWGIIVAENVLKIIPKGTHSYDKFVPPHQLLQILEKNHCRTVQISGASYNYFKNTWSPGCFKGLIYGAHAVKSAP